MKRQGEAMENIQYLESIIANRILEESLKVNNVLISYVTKACKFLQYSEKDLKKIILGVYLMDIGLKVDFISSEDYDNHTINGCMMMSGIDDVEIIKNIVLLHHENKIGTGFPYGLMGNEIPKYVQIVSICNDYLNHKAEGDLRYNEIISELGLLYNENMIEYLSDFIFDK